MEYSVIIEPEAFQDLQDIISFITQNDNAESASRFANELKHSISSLSEMPLRCRKSLYNDDENTRDLIYKGYTIVFQVRLSSVYILSVFRQRAY